jgi:peroxiredoxin
MFRNSSSTLRVGDRAPDFTLPTAFGGAVSASDLDGTVSMIVFFRGTW